MISISSHQLLDPPGFDFQMQTHVNCATSYPLDEDCRIESMPAQQMGRFRQYRFGRQHRRSSGAGLERCPLVVLVAPGETGDQWPSIYEKRAVHKPRSSR